jgi:hypothetical protein
MSVNRISSCLLNIWFVFLLVGCVSVGPRPKPTPNIPPQPRDAKADIMLLNIGPPSDTDGDTVPDTFSASTHMFDERYQLPVRIDGTITFILSIEDNSAPVHTWEFSGADFQSHSFDAQVGPVYRFRLQIPIDAPALRARFVTIQCVMTDKSGHVTQAWHRGMPWLSIRG